MARVKGGRYLIELGKIGDGDNVLSKLPKELIDLLNNHFDKSLGILNQNITKALKVFELSFYDNDSLLEIKGVTTTYLVDDGTELRLTIMLPFETSIYTYMFSIYGVADVGITNCDLSINHIELGS